MKHLTIEEKISRCITRHPDWLDHRVAKTVGCRMAIVSAVRSGEKMPGSSLSINPMSPGGMQGDNGSPNFVSLEKVIARYDIRAAILHEIGELPKGKLIVEAELCQRTAGTDRNRFRRTCENNPDEFKALRIKLRLDDGTEGKWYWGRREDIAEALKIVSL